jgi:hypothetical protein
MSEEEADEEVEDHSVDEEKFMKINRELEKHRPKSRSRNREEKSSLGSKSRVKQR